MRTVDWTGDGRLRTATFAGTRWLAHAQLWSPAERDAITTDDVETAAIVLAGTFDLVGGTTAWPARGARRTPFEGRPMAVFLPPRTTFRADGGRGEILLLAARQSASRPAADGREGLAHKPLLPLAGSGKAFDPTTGEWLPAEAFPSSPESLPPRRMQRLAAGGVTVERVLAPDYKAATLSVDEAVVPAGGELRLDAIPALPPHDELLVFVRGQAAGVRASGAELRVDGDAVFTALPGPLAIAAGPTPAYVVLGYAGKIRN